MNKKDEMLNHAAVFITCMGVGALVLIVIFNHSLAIVLSPLVVLLPLYYLLKWAMLRSYRLWKERERDSSLPTRISRGVVAMFLVVLLPTAPAKALDDDLAGAYAGLYSKTFGPTLSAFWQVWWFNFTETFKGSAPTPAPWNQIQKDHESGR